MSEPQAKKVKELLDLGWKVILSSPPLPGGPVEMVDPKGKRWFVKADGKPEEA